jgi:hypothetical protein
MIRPAVTSAPRNAKSTGMATAAKYVTDST